MAAAVVEVGHLADPRVRLFEFSDEFLPAFVSRDRELHWPVETAPTSVRSKCTSLAIACRRVHLPQDFLGGGLIDTAPGGPLDRVRFFPRPPPASARVALGRRV